MVFAAVPLLTVTVEELLSASRPRPSCTSTPARGCGRPGRWPRWGGPVTLCVSAGGDALNVTRLDNADAIAELFERVRLEPAGCAY
jgi:hypothetical protein